MTVTDSPSSPRPVVVYGASGYTGRLVCEYLREYGVPFVAAGRSAERLTDSMQSHVAGIETADYEVVEVEHTLEALTELVRGASVVLNTVGPFSKWGPEVVEACLATGAHYTDTTGEQDWLITCDERYGADFAAAGLLLAPGIAQMYTTGEIAAQLCLETPGLDTLDIAVFWGGSPTIASTQTILFNAATSAAHHLQQNQYVPFDPGQGLVPLVVPGQHELALSLPWGGTSHPVWFKRDPRVASCKAQGGVFNAALMHGVPQIVAAALEATQGMDDDERDAALAATAAQVMNQMPPRENPRLNKSLDSVHASGPLGRAHCVIHGNSNYKQTGLLQAYAAYSLLQQPPLRVGFASGCQAFGHRELLGVLRAFGLVAAPVLTVEG
ncbi:saccharopine dehydrogenase [Nocardioides dongxiaopingii]|nr:saccharopine dehydrogenase [Nocardioides sp. S-1144]